MQISQSPSPSVTVTQTGAGSPQGADQATIANQAWLANLSDAAVAAQNSNVGLQNAAASGVTVYIDRLRITSTVATQLFYSLEANPVLGAIGSVRNKQTAGVMAQPSARGGNNFGQASPMYVASLPVNGDTELVFSPPLAVPAGFTGVFGTGAGINLTLTAGAQGRSY